MLAMPRPPEDLLKQSLEAQRRKAETAEVDKPLKEPGRGRMSC
jgi:hypothetical protein